MKNLLFNNSFAINRNNCLALRYFISYCSPNKSPNFTICIDSNYKAKIDNIDKSVFKVDAFKNISNNNVNKDTKALDDVLEVMKA